MRAYWLLGAPIATGVALLLNGDATETPETPEETPKEEEDATALNITEVAVTSAVVTGAFYSFDTDTTFLSTFDRRLSYTLCWQGVAMLPLVYRLGSTLCRSLFAGSKQVKKATRRRKALLAEATNQTGLFVPAALILSTQLTVDQMHLIPILSCTFLTGQVLQSSKSSSLSKMGQALCYIPSIGAVLLAVSIFGFDSL